MMSGMRTTLTIERDVEQLLKREMRRTGGSLKATVNNALRKGLGAQGKQVRSSRFSVEPHPLDLKPGWDGNRMNQYVDELEVEEIAKRYGR